MGKRTECKKGRRKIGILVVAVIVLISSLWLWKVCCEKDAHRMPKSGYINIEEIVKKQNWSREEYKILREQTGLSEAALQYLKQQGRQEELIDLQKSYFQAVTIQCAPNTVISCEEFLTDTAGNVVSGMQIPYVEDGDILITNCSHCLGWRNGHAGIVIDA